MVKTADHGKGMSMEEIFLTTSPAARRFSELLGEPRSENWVRLAADSGKLPCIVTSTGRRLFRESDIVEFVGRISAKADEAPQPAA
jgi:hypothetical protein